MDPTQDKQDAIARRIKKVEAPKPKPSDDEWAKAQDSTPIAGTN